MSYASEQLYKTEYLCGREPVVTAGFDFYLRSASQLIARATFNRVDEGNVPNCVKMCCCELAELVFKHDQTGSEVQSEKVGDWSKTYGSVAEREAAYKSAVSDTLKKWLGGTGLLYRGLDYAD